MKYPQVFVAGTFDGLHKGHRFFLLKAFSIGRNVTIGLTSDQFVKKNKTSFEIRKKILEQWLQKNNVLATIISINDPYEPAVSFPQSVALLVTPDNKHRGVEINTIRKKRGLPSFQLVEVPLVNAEDGKPISSTRVRAQEIDNEGQLILPDSLRPELKIPLGPVRIGQEIAESIEHHRSDYIITIGDIATKTMLDAGITPALMIIDNKVERKPYDGLKKYRLSQNITVTSGPGYISTEAIALIKKKPKVIVVDGEEDLLALPAIAYAPIGSIVYYGQPKKGLVEVEVTSEKKNQAIALLSRFVILA